MAFREVPMYEVKEVLRLWLAGQSLRSIAEKTAVDRKTVRRYVAGGVDAGLEMDGGEAQLTDDLLGVVAERVRPVRTNGRGEAWRLLEAHADEITAWLETDGLTVKKVHSLLSRTGVFVPARTLERFCAALCGPRRGRTTTVRLSDGEPGTELQCDFGRMGILFDPATGRRRVCHALVFTAVVSRHCFVWLTFSQTTEAVIEGCEEAWGFFGGVFCTLIPDNMTPVVTKTNPLEPRLNRAFVEYAQARGFHVDAARVRHPKDKARVERAVAYVRNSFFKGEQFCDLEDARRRAVGWCTSEAGLRVHGTTALRPAEHFAVVEAAHLLAPPTAPYDVPTYARPKVHRDHYIEVAKALYSMPTAFIGRHVDVRADRELVKVYLGGKLVKTHPRQPPGGRSTDPNDFPEHTRVYALRDVEHLRSLAFSHGQAIGAYAAALLEHPLPWTKMRQVYALLGLVKKWGPSRVEAACARAAEAEAFNVHLIGRMLERGTEHDTEPVPIQGKLVPARFLRPAEDFMSGARR
jgi:transposase